MVGGVARSTPAKRPQPPTHADDMRPNANALRTCNGEEEQFARQAPPVQKAGGAVGLWERFPDTTTDASAASAASVGSLDVTIPPSRAAPPVAVPSTATPATLARNSKHAEGRRQGATATAASAVGKAVGGGGTGKVVGGGGTASCMRHFGDEDDDDFMDDVAERRPLRRIPATTAAAAAAAAATTTTQVETDVEAVHDRATADGDEGAAAVAVRVIKLPAAPELPPWATRVGG